jgi:pimeloyl-ACP methyl ester carboxylesterase
VPFAQTDDGVRIYYEQHGTEGSTLALAYGLGGTTAGWDVNVEALSARHRLLLWDPRGHGRSGSPRDPSKYRFSRWADDLRSVLDQIQVQKAHVGGLSLGGAIATHFALRYPARVLSLVIASSGTAAGRPLSVGDLLMRARSVQLAVEEGMDAVAEFAMSENANYRARLALDPGAREEILAEYRSADRMGYANSVRVMIGSEYIADQLPTIKVPVLLLTGDCDPTLRTMRAIHRQIPGSKFIVIPSAGHFANREQASIWNRSVMTFLTDVAEGRSATRRRRSTELRRR